MKDLLEKTIFPIGALIASISSILPLILSIMLKA